MNIILYGLKSCGKTTVGKALSKLTQYDVIDTDTEIERYYESISGQSKKFTEIYRVCGDKVFRELERKVIDTVSQQHRKPTLISVGGSTLVDANNYHRLQSFGVFYYLYLDYQSWLGRIDKLDVKPNFLETEHLKSHYYQQRDLLYSELADHKIICNHHSSCEIANQIRSFISPNS